MPFISSNIEQAKLSGPGPFAAYQLVKNAGGKILIRGELRTIPCLWGIRNSVGHNCLSMPGGAVMVSSKEEAEQIIINNGFDPEPPVECKR